jgi:putative transposase
VKRAIHCRGSTLALGLEAKPDGTGGGCHLPMNVTEVTTTPGSPWQNAYAERVIGTIRRECLDHVIVMNEAHLHRVVEDYLRYYHEDRTHQGLGRDAPKGRAREAPDGHVIAVPRAGGLHHRYIRVA